MALPLKIDPCPIKEAGFEVRFTAAIYGGAVFGILYSVLKDSHPSSVVKLPILQLPEELRDQDPSLVYQPHYQISNEQFILQIGPRVMVLACKLPYPGWEAFKQEIVAALAAIIKTGAVDTIERMGLRYVNVFDGDLTGELTLSIKSDVHYESQAVSMRMTVLHEGLMNHISINNETMFGDTPARRATVLDIDTFIDLETSATEWKYAEILEQMHGVEKSIFFATLNKSLLDQLNPTYAPN